MHLSDCLPQVLLVSGVKVDVHDYKGETPLHEASERGYLDIVKVPALSQ